MGSEATAVGVEASGLTLLDIVKHAAKTIINTLNENDRLSIVSYSNNAETLFDLIPMNNVGKENAIALLCTLEPDGMTNLWDGLNTGLNVLKNRVPVASRFGDNNNTSTTSPTNTTSTQNTTSNTLTTHYHNNASLLLLTDGEPNVEPPRGYLPMLKKYKKQNNGVFPGIINTFGFGYSLDSKLLNEIAIEGNGIYSFIPDSGFVGTAFVNSLANILSTVTSDAQLCIQLNPTSGAR